MDSTMEVSGEVFSPEWLSFGNAEHTRNEGTTMFVEPRAYSSVSFCRVALDAQPVNGTGAKWIFRPDNRGIRPAPNTTYRIHRRAEFPQNGRLRQGIVPYAPRPALPLSGAYDTAAQFLLADSVVRRYLFRAFKSLRSPKRRGRGIDVRTFDAWKTPNDDFRNDFIGECVAEYVATMLSVLHDAETPVSPGVEWRDDRMVAIVPRNGKRKNKRDSAIVPRNSEDDSRDKIIAEKDEADFRADAPPKVYNGRLRFQKYAKPETELFRRAHFEFISLPNGATGWRMVEWVRGKNGEPEPRASFLTHRQLAFMVAIRSANRVSAGHKRKEKDSFPPNAAAPQETSRMEDWEFALKANNRLSERDKGIVAEWANGSTFDATGNQFGVHASTAKRIVDGFCRNVRKMQSQRLA